MAFTLREYQETDRERVIELFDDFQDYLVTLDPLHRLRRLPGCGAQLLDETLKEICDQRGVFSLALADDAVVGFIVGTIEELKDRRDVIDATVGRITELYVDAASRGQGIGTTLMEHVESWFKAQGCDVVKVEVFAPNAPARRLYEKFGYTWRDIDNIKKLS